MEENNANSSQSQTESENQSQEEEKTQGILECLLYAHSLCKGPYKTIVFSTIAVNLV